MAKEVVEPGMQLHLPAAFLACFAAAANAAPTNDAPTSVALIPIGGELNEDQRRLLDAALRAELKSSSNQLLDENERLTHVRGARSLGLGCQVEASPACLTFIADVAGLAGIYVGSAENGRIRMARYRFENGEITERMYSEAEIPAPGASYVRIAQTLLRFVPNEVSAVDIAPDVAIAANDTSRADPANPVLAQERERNASTLSEAEEATAEGTPPMPMLTAPGRGLDWQTLSLPIGLSGAAVMALGASSWGLSQWVARTPLTSQVTGTKSVSDRLQLIDATESVGLALVATGVLLTTAGGGLALWPQIASE